MNFNCLNYLGTRYKVGQLIIDNRDHKDYEILHIESNFIFNHTYNHIHIKHRGRRFIIGFYSLRLYYKIKD